MKGLTNGTFDTPGNMLPPKSLRAITVVTNFNTAADYMLQG